MSDLEKAYELFERGARDIREAGRISSSELRMRLRGVAHGILDALDDTSESDDMMSDFDRQAKDIADDLRRAERLMRQRSRGL